MTDRAQLHRQVRQKMFGGKLLMRERRGVPVLIISIEMTADSLGWRMLFGRAGVDMALYKQGFKKADDDMKLANAAAKLAADAALADELKKHVRKVIGPVATPDEVRFAAALQYSQLQVGFFFSTFRATFWTAASYFCAGVRISTR